jgi:hypothetical protein
VPPVEVAVLDISIQSTVRQLPDGRLPGLNPQNPDFPRDKLSLALPETDLLPLVVLHSSSSGLWQVCLRSEPVGSQQTFERTAEPRG